MKLDIIRALKKGSFQRVVGRKFGVAKSTVADIWKSRQKISDSIVASESSLYAKKRCIVRKVKYNLVDDTCWKWLNQQCSKGALVSGLLIQENQLVEVI